VNREAEELFRRWQESEQRSHGRRRPLRRGRLTPARLLIAVLSGVLLGGLTVGAAKLVGDPATKTTEDLEYAERLQTDREPARRARAGHKKVPSAAAVRDAWSYARDRGGLVSFAVVDTEGRLRGRDEGRRYVSASVVKAMLLTAALRWVERSGQPLDETIATTLRAMITYSDNAAADSIYFVVGDRGLYEVARHAGLKRFSVDGYWANAQITAADMARFFATLDEQMDGPHREFALGLLGSVIPEQSWGIPKAAEDDWAVRFKGGWRTTERGWLVHQAAELRDGDRRFALAVLTDAQPSQRYAIRTVRGIAERLLASAR